MPGCVRAVETSGLLRKDLEKMNEIYRIKKGFLLRRMGGSAVVVAVDEAAKSFKGVIKLNEVGAFLWERLNEGATVEQLVQAVTDAYDVEREQARANIESFLAKAKEGGLLV